MHSDRISPATFSLKRCERGWLVMRAEDGRTVPVSGVPHEHKRVALAVIRECEQRRAFSRRGL